MGDLQGKLCDTSDRDATPVVDFLRWLVSRYPLPKDLRVLDVGAGVETLDAKGAYDLITMVNDPSAYLLTIDERIEALDRLYRALRPGGLILLEIKNFRFQRQQNESLTEVEQGIGSEEVVNLCQTDIEAHRAMQSRRDEYRVGGLDNTIRKEYKMSVIAAPELLRFLHKQGFVNVQTYANYEAREPGEVNDRAMLVSARKPSNEYE